jgi:hypothetical protein
MYVSHLREDAGTLEHKVESTRIFHESHRNGLYVIDYV